MRHQCVSEGKGTNPFKWCMSVPDSVMSITNQQLVFGKCGLPVVDSCTRQYSLVLCTPKKVVPA